MKHRKFVKQLMSTGHDRNLAENMAQICQGCREPYAHAMQRYQKIMREKHRSWWSYYFLATLPAPPQGGGRA